MASKYGVKLLALLLVSACISWNAVCTSPQCTLHGGNPAVRNRQKEIFAEHREIQSRERETLLMERKFQINSIPAGQLYQLKVQFDTTPLLKLENKSTYTFLTTILAPRLAKYFEKLLKLRQPPASAVQPFFSECYESRFSKSFVFDGGLGILMTASTYNEVSPTYVAFSVVCRLDKLTNRPILGQLNLNPKEILPRHSVSIFETCVHELFHIVGFSSELFPFFINGDLDPLGPELFVRSPEGEVVGLKTPRLLQEAREYYTCPDVQSIPLEDDGASGSRGSHWERSQFADELMTASSQPNSKVSGFTLALLEDSGWYSPEYLLKEQFSFGKQSGCTIPTVPECAEIFSQGCSMDFKSKGFCRKDMFASGVQTMVAIPDGLCAGDHRSRINSPDKFLQLRAFRSTCFEVDFTRTINRVNYALQGGACYEALCLHGVSGELSVAVKVNGKLYTCVEDNQVIVLQDEILQGSLKCPNLKAYCLADRPCEEGCMQVGRCLENGGCFYYDP